jgi:hypothetical protein
MGHSYPTAEQRRISNERWEREQDERVEAVRKELAGKIVMVAVDRIVAEIIRPGPKPEERECYVMAAELRAITPDLEELVKQIIDVNDGVE